MPSNTIALLGQSKDRRSGFSTATQLPHTGMVYFSSLVQDTPPDLRRKVSRIVAAKVTPLLLLLLDLPPPPPPPFPLLPPPPHPR